MWSKYYLFIYLSVIFWRWLFFTWFLNSIKHPFEAFLDEPGWRYTDEDWSVSLLKRLPVWFEMWASKAVSRCRVTTGRGLCGVLSVCRGRKSCSRTMGEVGKPSPQRCLKRKAVLFWMTNLRFRNGDDTCKASYAMQTAVALKLFYNSSGFWNEFKDKLVLLGCIRPWHFYLGVLLVLRASLYFLHLLKVSGNTKE